MPTMQLTGVQWRKSSRSGDETNKAQCVELADLSAAIGVRDSQAPGAGHLTVSRAALATMFGEIRGGRLDL